MPFTWVSNFCFTSLLPFLSIVRILSSQAILFKILLYVLFQRFSWSALLPFPSYVNLHNLMYLGIDVSTHDLTITLQMALNYHIFNLQTTRTLSPRTSVVTLSISSIPHIIQIIGRFTPRSLASFTTVSSHISQQYKKSGPTSRLIKLPPLLQR